VVATICVASESGVEDAPLASRMCSSSPASLGSRVFVIWYATLAKIVISIRRELSPEVGVVGDCAGWEMGSRSEVSAEEFKKVTITRPRHSAQAQTPTMAC
jgi:hypothetical protein